MFHGILWLNMGNTTQLRKEQPKMSTKKEYHVNVVMFGGPERLACTVLSNSLKNAVRQIKARPPFSMRNTYFVFETGNYSGGVSITC